MSEVPLHWRGRGMGRRGAAYRAFARSIQGYLTYKKVHPPPGSPKGPRLRPTLGSYGGGLFMTEVPL